MTPTTRTYTAAELADLPQEAAPLSTRDYADLETLNDLFPQDPEPAFGMGAVILVAFGSAFMGGLIVWLVA